MDAQSICHNRSQLIIPQENHRTFVSVYNWICAAGVRQHHNPACNSHLCLPRALKAPRVWPRETWSKGNMDRSSVSPHFLHSLSRPQWRKIHPHLTLGRWIILFVKYLAASKVSWVWWNWKEPEKNNPIVRGTMFRKTWFVAIHTLFWESVCSLTWQTSSASKYFG